MRLPIDDTLMDEVLLCIDNYLSLEKDIFIKMYESQVLWHQMKEIMFFVYAQQGTLKHLHIIIGVITMIIIVVMMWCDMILMFLYGI